MKTVNEINLSNRRKFDKTRLWKQKWKCVWKQNLSYIWKRWKGWNEKEEEGEEEEEERGKQRRRRRRRRTKKNNNNNNKNKEEEEEEEKEEKQITTTQTKTKKKKKEEQEKKQEQEQEKENELDYDILNYGYSRKIEMKRSVRNNLIFYSYCKFFIEDNFEVLEYCRVEYWVLEFFRTLAFPCRILRMYLLLKPAR